MSSHLDSSDYRARISARTGEPAVPILVRNMNGGAGRIWWVPVRYWRLAAATYDGKRFTHRELAKQIGYSVAGLHHALRSMTRMGLGSLTSTRSSSIRSFSTETTIIPLERLIERFSPQRRGLLLF